ncbi:MAG: hypothetical protein FP820_03760 [Sulfurimonas sp.]|nr:hypothetical protein [Sulfurimonas sp.]MBU1217981.1 hypothetical protein [bacterium]MBU1435218.1 hypothetical protein [bacterium]MBU1502875.1 hypothetical protein [bacterium]MBU3938041.1 hypothetical protein [bacterium]
MSWLNFFESKTKMKHAFGRGTNATISEDEEELFNKSYEAFEKKDFINAYEYFFNSLQNFTNEVANDNIIMQKDENELRFELFQGTAKVTGIITQDTFHAEVIMIKKSDANVALKRYLLERNYQLTYANYFADDFYIKLKLFHDNATMSPQKIFFPMREIALNADFDKEHIKSEFKEIELQDIAHLQVMDEEELQIKFDYLNEQIAEVELKVATLPSNDNAGMQAFLYLNLLFEIDYLLVPKYSIYQNMSKTVVEYFSDDDTTIESKNEELKRYVSTLKEMAFEEFRSNFYNAKYTFSQTEKTSFEELNIFIHESLMKIRWYKNNRYNQIIPTIYKYIAFYILYNYGLNPVIRNLLHLLVEIQNPDFFKKLGYQTLYNQDENNFSKRTIISRIEEIISPNQKRYKLLKPFGNELNFTSMNELSNSYYLQLKNLNFEEI